WGLYKFTLSLKIYLKPLIPDHLSQKGSDEVVKAKWKKIIMVRILLSAVIFLLFLSFMTVSDAGGLVDDTISDDNIYSLYRLDVYQLDFFVDSGWDWWPWN